MGPCWACEKIGLLAYGARAQLWAWAHGLRPRPVPSLTLMLLVFLRQPAWIQDSQSAAAPMAAFLAGDGSSSWHSNQALCCFHSRVALNDYVPLFCFNVDFFVRIWDINSVLIVLLLVFCCRLPKENKNCWDFYVFCVDVASNRLLYLFRVTRS